MWNSIEYYYLYFEKVWHIKVKIMLIAAKGVEIKLQLKLKR